MKCQSCASERVMQVSGKTSDMCYHRLAPAKGRHGYVPSGLNVGGGDYLEFNVCLDCGQMQGKWPVPAGEEDE